MAEERDRSSKEGRHPEPRERQPKKREHDPDSEAPRTAEPPGDSGKKEWDRQEGC